MKQRKTACVWGLNESFTRGARGRESASRFRTDSVMNQYVLLARDVWAKKRIVVLGARLAPIVNAESLLRIAYSEGGVP